MKFLNRIFLIISVALSLSACVDSAVLSTDEVETIALQSWMEINRPDLLDNYQVNGGYYVEVLEEGVADSAAVRYDDSWVWFDVTCRDLSGNVAMTRNSDLARMQNVYTDHTHYVPYYLYCGESRANSLPEGIYLSLRNKLKVGDKDISARYGTKLRLYMPSSLVSDTGNGMSGDGGYQGQYSLSANRPMIAEVKVWGHVGNPLAYEDQWVRAFAKANGGLAPEPENKEKAAAASSLRRSFKRDTRADENAPTIYDELWYPAVDSIAGLYINYLYTPKKPLNFDCLGQDTLIYEGQTGYSKGKIFGAKSLAQINQEIDAALLKRFGEGLNPADADTLGTVSKAKIWYVTRLLDGFVVDTNITEVQKIVYSNDYDALYDTSSALDFMTSKDASEDNSYVDAWLYAVPQMKLGAWNVILTTSSNAYGALGVAGSSSSSLSSNNYNDYYNYYNYYNSYYGNSYYNNYYNGYYGMGGMGMGGMYGGMGGMYGGMYGGYDYYNNYYNSMYYNSYYNNSYYTDTSSDEDVAITTTSEILPYTPLLWQVFIEEE